MNLAELWIKFYWVCVHWAIFVIVLRKAFVPRDEQYNKPLLYLWTTEPLFYVFGWGFIKLHRKDSNI